MECWFTIRGAFSLVALPQTDAMSKTPPSADDYRKRAAAIGKRLGASRAKGNTVSSWCAGSNRRSSTLADNEDWLAGKSKEKEKENKAKAEGESATALAPRLVGLTTHAGRLVVRKQARIENYFSRP